MFVAVCIGAFSLVPYCMKLWQEKKRLAPIVLLAFEVFWAAFPFLFFE